MPHFKEENRVAEIFTHEAFWKASLKKNQIYLLNN